MLTGILFNNSFLYFFVDVIALDLYSQVIDEECSKIHLGRSLEATKPAMPIRFFCPIGSISFFAVF